MPPLEQLVSVPPGDISLFTRSVGEGPDVVVLHGGPGAHHDYLLPQFDALARGRRLRYYDQRGGGRSPIPYDVAAGWEHHVNDLDALLDHWGIDGATLLGYSWGGLLALLYLIRHPRRVHRLALVSPAPATADGRRTFERNFAERSASPGIAALRAELQGSGLRDTDPEAYRQRAFELSVAGYFADPRRARDLTPFRVTGRTQKAVWESLGDYDLREDLRHQQLPALVLHGSHDPIPTDTARETAELLGATFVPMTNSGHVPYIEDADAFLAALDAFLPSA